MNSLNNIEKDESFLEYKSIIFFLASFIMFPLLLLIGYICQILFTNLEFGDVIVFNWSSWSVRFLAFGSLLYIVGGLLYCYFVGSIKERN